MTQHLTSIHTDKATGRSWYQCTCGHQSSHILGGNITTLRAIASVHRGSRRKQTQQVAA